METIRSQRWNGRGQNNRDEPSAVVVKGASSARSADGLAISDGMHSERMTYSGCRSGHWGNYPLKLVTVGVGCHAISRGEVRRMRAQTGVSRRERRARNGDGAV